VSEVLPILTLKHLLSHMKQATSTQQNMIGTVGTELRVSMSFLPWNILQFIKKI